MSESSPSAVYTDLNSWTYVGSTLGEGSRPLVPDNMQVYNLYVHVLEKSEKAKKACYRPYYLNSQNRPI